MNNNKIPTLSACMICRNEEDNLQRTLPYLAESVDEIIFVDTGSTDQTIKVAGQCTENIYHFEWCDDYAAARNESLKHATSDWIIWIDADECFLKKDKDFIWENYVINNNIK